MFRFYSLLTAGIGICTVVSCSPVKGYQGPDLPENQIANIQYLEQGSDEVSVQNARTGPYTFSSAGINVLPGKHLVEMDIEVKGQSLGYNCRAEPSFNDYGFQQCNKDRRKQNNYQQCDCFEYLTIYRVCQVEVARGSCSGEMLTTAGGKHAINVRKNGMKAEAYCLSCGTGGPVNFNCTDFVSSFVEDRDYVGTGRSNAYAAGIYSCGYY